MRPARLPIGAQSLDGPAFLVLDPRDFVRLSPVAADRVRLRFSSATEPLRRLVMRPVLHIADQRETLDARGQGQETVRQLTCGPVSARCARGEPSARAALCVFTDLRYDVAETRVHGLPPNTRVFPARPGLANRPRRAVIIMLSRASASRGNARVRWPQMKRFGHNPRCDRAASFLLSDQVGLQPSIAAAPFGRPSDGARICRETSDRDQQGLRSTRCNIGKSSSCSNVMASIIFARMSRESLQ